MKSYKGQEHKILFDIETRHLLEPIFGNSNMAIDREEHDVLTMYADLYQKRITTSVIKTTNFVKSIT